MAIYFEKFLNQVLLGNSGKEYLFSLLIFICLIILFKIIKHFFLIRLKKIALKTKNQVDDILVEVLETIHWPFYVYFAFDLSIKILIIPLVLKNIMDYAVIIIIVFYIVKAINRIISFYSEKEIKRRKDIEGEKTSVVSVFSKLLQGTVWLIAFLFVLSNFGIQITSLIAGVGIGGIAIAFALQKILEDIFSSFTIYLDKPFEEGDYIVIGEDSGTVKHIGLKTTRIRHLQGQELVVSNRELTSTRIHNYKKMKRRRASFSFRVVYNTPVKKLEKIKNIIKKLLEKIESAELERVHFKELGESSLNYEIVYYLNSKDYNKYMDIQEFINIELIKAFEKEKIEFAYPTQTIILEK